jgi:putative transposase
MARQPRLTVAAYPHHIIQRGNNRQLIVLDDADRHFLLALWQAQAQACQVAVHAYVLMSNHFHLLVTPDTADGVPRMMQAVGRSYVRYFNNRHGRSGTLWEGRYRSTLIETERYLLACMVYIDLNPVRAGLAETAADYPWSSHRHNAGMSVDKLVTPHALLWSLGNTPFAREAAYRELVRAGVAPSQQQALTSATLSGWALGSEAFKRGLQDNTRRRIAPGQRGRPPGPATSGPKG